MRHAIVLVLVGAACGSTPIFGPQPVSPDAVRKACAMELSCLSPAPITSGGNCVAEFEDGLASGYGIFFGPSAADLARYVKCASSASDCTTALNCASKSHGPTWCAAHPAAACDGDTLIGCLGGWGLAQTDCTLLGLHCLTANGVSLCSDGKSCDPATSGTCVGNSLVECDSTAKIGSAIDCGKVVSGGTCKHITTGAGSSETGCFAPPTPSCPATTSMDGCDGTAVLACDYGNVFRIDCSQFASHCTAISSDKHACVPDATDCTQDSPDSCVGNAIRMCVNGKWTTTACSSLGLSTCQTMAMGVKCS